MHPEDAPPGAAEPKHRRFLGVTLQIESHAPSNPLRTHKEKKEEEEEERRGGGGNAVRKEGRGREGETQSGRREGEERW